MAKQSRRTSRRGLRLSAATGAALVLLALAAVLVGVRLSGPLSEAGDDATAGGALAASGPYAFVEGVTRRATRMWDAAGRVAVLERENRALREWRTLAERLAERNARYEALLRMTPDSFGQGGDGARAIGAQLVLDSGGPFTRTLVANAGAEHGVRIGYIAVNESGLVGRVVSVGRRSARILLLDDYNSRIPVMGAHSRVRAIMVGQAAEPPQLLTRPFAVEAPRLDFEGQGLRVGEPIITSGDGGLFPRGVRVGAARLGADGRWRVALPAASAGLDFVRIVPFVRQTTPEREGLAPDAGPPFEAPSGVLQGAPPPPQRVRPRVAPSETPAPTVTFTPAPSAPTPPAPAPSAPPQ